MHALMTSCSPHSQSHSYSSITSVHLYQASTTPDTPAQPPVHHGSPSSTMPPPSSIPPSRKRKSGGPHPIAPAPAPTPAPSNGFVRPKGIPAHVQSSPSASASSLEPEADTDGQGQGEGDGDYQPSSGKRPAARGVKRKANPSTAAASGGGRPSKMSREAVRKANHSLIERRRREKINAALSELRGMVPGLGEEGGGKGGEFKLEVLERTVAHMKDLKKHIEQLEAALAAHGIRFDVADTSSKGDEESGSDDDDADGGDDQARKAGSIGNLKPESNNVDVDMRANEPSQYPIYQAKNGGDPISRAHHAHTHRHSPYPSPSPDVSSHTLSPDPNETEVEGDLPPAFTKAAPRLQTRHSLDYAKGYSTSSVPSVHAQAHSQAHSRSTTASSPRRDSREATQHSDSSIPHGSGAPSVASLFASAQARQSSPISGLSRPPPPPQANNPIFLPFPAPSPTSPFMHPSIGSNGSASASASSMPMSMYNGTGSGGASVGSSQHGSGPDPSPFLAPMGGMSLFGGVISLDPMSPVDSVRPSTSKGSPPHLSLPPPPNGVPPESTDSAFKASSNASSRMSSSGGKSQASSEKYRSKSGCGEADAHTNSNANMPAEEAANLLLAFSSPDTLRPTQMVLPLPSPLFNPTHPQASGRGHTTSKSVSSDEFEFSLDSTGKGLKNEDMVGKSAGEILRMREFQR